MSEPLRVYACARNVTALYTAEMGNALCRKNKMHNTPVVIDGIRFQSTAEGNYWQRASTA